MKVPEYIKKSILLSAKYNKIADKHNEIVRDWLEKNGLIDEDTLDGNCCEMVVDYLEFVYDGEGFIKFIEEEKWR